MLGLCVSAQKRKTPPGRAVPRCAVLCCVPTAAGEPRLDLVGQFPAVGGAPQAGAEQFAFEDELLGEAVQEAVEEFFVAAGLGGAGITRH